MTTRPGRCARPACCAPTARRLLVALLLLVLPGGAVAGCAEGRTAMAVVVQLPPGAPNPPADAFPARVERVVDGDTMVAVRGSERVRVRFIGVDSPESVKPNTPVECWGKQSSALTKKLLAEGTTLTAAYEPGGRTDRYDRELWDIWLPDGRFVQAVLVASGAARPRAWKPQIAHQDYLVSVEAVAQEAQVGLYGSCPIPTWAKK